MIAAISKRAALVLPTRRRSTLISRPTPVCSHAPVSLLTISMLMMMMMMFSMIMMMIMRMRMVMKMVIMMVMLNCLGANLTTDPTDNDCYGYTDEDDDGFLRFGIISIL